MKSISTALALTIALVGASAKAALVTAELAPFGSTGFNVGAGIAFDPPAPTAFDNRLAQTFTATVGGVPFSASFIVTGGSSYTAPLVVDLVTLSGNQVSGVLATGSLAVSSIPTDLPSGPLAYTAVVPLSAMGSLLTGQSYAVVLRSATPDANYRLTGTSGAYGSGELLESQNSPQFQPLGFGADLFFQVTVVPEPTGADALACLATGLAAQSRSVRRRRV